jgi:hypothetical protein
VTEAAGELRESTASPDDEVFEAPPVLRIVWADPQHMAEHIAVWSLARFGPRADKAVKKLHNDQPDADRRELERSVIERRTHVAMTEGAFVGGPFIVLIPFAFCAALLAQAQMVYELAAVAGHEPNDQMRAAELLVLLGAYESTDDATSALATLASNPDSREGKKLPRGTRWQMVKRMAYLLGLFGTGDETRSRLRVALGWTGIGVLCVVGLVLPLVWVPYMAYSSRRSTLALGDRARTYYAAHTGEGDAGITVRRRQVVRVGGTAALARTMVFVVLPIAAALVALLTHFSFGGGRWVGSGLLLLAVSALVTFGWLGRRWWRHRPTHAQVA